jgi:hypothetical protein
MATTIKLKNGSGAPLAGDLVQGEPALDLTNKRLYTEDAGGTVIEVGTNPSTIDINAGTIDGTVIGGASAAAGTFTTFTSTGIDDNATSTAITIDSSQNVGIGTTSPATFNAAQCNNLVVGTGSGGEGITVYSGTTSQGGLAFADGTSASDQYRGLIQYDHNSNNMLFWTNTSERMRIDSSGNVGIGTASPVESSGYNSLTINDTTSGYLALQSAGSTKMEAYVSGGTEATLRGTGVPLALTTTAAHDITFDTNAAERMRIDSSGNVGIGTTSPNISSGASGSVVLTVSATTSGRNGLIELRGTRTSSGEVVSYLRTFNNSGATPLTDIQSIRGASDTVGQLAFFTSNTERMRIDSSGNVGIGTTPSSWSAAFDAIDLGPYASFSADNDTTFVTNNAYYNGTNWIYKNSNLAGRYRQQQGFHVWDTAVSGTAGGTLTWSETMRIDASGNVGIGTSNPSFILGTGLHIDSTGYTSIVLQKGGAGQGHNIDFTDENNTLQYRIGTNFASGGENLLFAYGSTPTIGMTLNSSGNVGIGTTSPSSDSIVKFLHINDATSSGLVLQGAKKFSVYSSSSSSLIFRDETAGTNRITLDSSGNLLVGKTAPNSATAGVQILPEGDVGITRNGSHSLLLNRLTSDGDIALFRKDGTTVGSIGNLTSSSMYINGNGSAVANLGFGGTSLIYPTVDNVADLGIATFRFDDIYATNDVIQTSDANEKQDIEALSEAETRVAVAAKALLRKFRWKSAVEEKGDEARIHFGIVAQDLKAAFEAEGLDAGRYAMFIHSTWTDEETGEERSRMGVRYSELLAFIIAAI